jgi:hypothetical protein
MKLSTALAVAVALVASGGSPLMAQSRPERPYRGLFASGAATDVAQTLIATGSVGGGYDTSVLAEAGEAGLGTAPTGPPRSSEGSFALMSEGLAYTLGKSRFSLAANEFASARYYPTVGNNFLTNYGGSLAASWSASRRTQFTASQAITYEPFSFYSLFPQLSRATFGEFSLADLDFSTTNGSFFTYDTSVSATHQFSSRTSLIASYDRHASDYAGQYANFNNQTGSVRLTHSVKAGFGFHVGYGYSHVVYGDVPNLGRHLIDTGVDYNKTLSFSRRSTLSFTTGGTATSERDHTYVSAIATAVFNHEIGRTWNFSAGYDRNVGFVETFASPYVYDSGRLSLNGLLGRRLSFHSSAGVSLGNVGFGQAAHGQTFDTYYASAGLGQALSRNLNLDIGYSYYRYRYDGLLLLPAVFEQDMTRHSLHVSLSAWLPLMQRGRRSNAPR